MPIGFKGEKHHAASGDVTQVSPVANGDGQAADASHDKDVEASGAAQTKSAISARRKEIDKAAATPRWEG